MIGTSLQKEYAGIGRWLLHHGRVEWNERTGSRIIEHVGMHLHLIDPTRSMPIGTGRKLVPAIGVVEALQLVGGWSDPDLTCRVAPNMAQFLDEGAFHGAYGLRVGSQFGSVLDRLRADSTSRQAVLTLWDPKKDGADGPRDLPCTVSLQFMLRRDALDCLAYMRSNDFWWGLSYDVFQFTQLQLTLATMLGVDVGHYHHFAGSFHTYERDWDKIDDLTLPKKEHPLAPGFAVSALDTVETVRATTRGIATGHLSTRPVASWYVDTMRPYV